MPSPSWGTSSRERSPRDLPPRSAGSTPTRTRSAASPTPSATEGSGTEVSGRQAAAAGGRLSPPTALLLRQGLQVVVDLPGLGDALRDLGELPHEGIVRAAASLLVDLLDLHQVRAPASEEVP